MAKNNYEFNAIELNILIIFPKHRLSSVSCVLIGC